MHEPIVARLGRSDISLIAQIDRSEHIDVEYGVEGGELRERPVSMREVPSWDPMGTGPHSVAAKMAFCEPLVDAGATFLGCLDHGSVLGLAVVDGTFEPPMAWMAFLHVSRPHRRRGVASALWDASVEVARSAGAESMYVSATPTRSAVGFYLSRGCELADSVHPSLYEMEPDDIHLIYRLG